MHLKELLQLANKLYSQADYDSVKLIQKLVQSHVQLNSGLAKKAAIEITAPTVVLIRHGETEFNSSDNKENEKLRGWLDIQLNEQGYVQAEKLGQFFMNYPIARIISSDLNRARETAKSIMRYTNADIKLASAFRPWNLGAVMGKPVRDYVPIMLDYIQREKEIPPGSTESFHTFQTRFLGKMNEIMHEAIDRKDNGIVVCVAHSRNTRALRGWVMAGANNINILDKRPLLDKDDPVKTGHFMTIQFDGQKWNIVELENQNILDQ